MLSLSNLLVLFSLLIVFLILAWGIITMARGGKYNKSMSNLIMRYRIVFQAIAIIIFLTILFLRRNNYG